MNGLRSKRLCAFIAAAVASGGALLATDTQARITKITITSNTLAFGGASIGSIGTYDRIVGTAFGELNPKDAFNSVIVDLINAPKNAKGNVEYSFDFYILKPTDLTKGNNKLFYEAPNRGGKQFAGFNRSTGGADPATTSNAASTFLAMRGYSMAWSGWDFAAGTNNANLNLTIKLPVAKNADGTSITGPSYEYIVMGNATTKSYTLNYAAASADQSKATLTWRHHLDDVPTAIPSSGWAYTDATNSAIKLTPDTAAFAANDIYEFSYTAKDPTVNGVGFAAIRDWNAFLRYGSVDDIGTANPLTGHVQRIYTYALSQPARTFNDFTNLGFNQSEDGRKVFDGMLQWIGAGDGINMNLRFSQTGRTERNRQDQLYAEGVFPFSNVTMKDHITGKTAGRYDRCSASNTCPYAMEIYSANEYWVKSASLLHTNTQGTADVPDHPMARNYLISSHQHGVGNGTTRGSCRELGNPLDSAPIQRALFVAMEQWVESGMTPPASQVPTLASGTLVKPDQASTGFPKIPGVLYTGLKSTRYRWDYGPMFDQGVMTINPPVVSYPFFDNPKNGPIYPSLVPKTDSDGNDVAGVRLADVRVPLATYTGWSLRSDANDGPDGCEGSGQMIPFAKTAADRMASGDPRLSVEERYGTFGNYYWQRLFVIDQMMESRLLLGEDAMSEFNKGLTAAAAAGLK